MELNENLGSSIFIMESHKYVYGAFMNYEVSLMLATYRAP